MTDPNTQVRPLITRQPCDKCYRAGSEGDTGAFVCLLYGERDSCPTWQAVNTELVGKAVASAEHWQARIRHTPAEVRREAIETEAGAYEEWAASLGATFDAVAWTALCGVAKAVPV